MTTSDKKPRSQPAAAPVYAAVGAADLAIEQLRKTLSQVETLADSIRKDLEDRVAKANVEAYEAAVKAGKAAQDAPEQVLNQGLSVASLATQAYKEMTQRGQRVVGKGARDLLEDKRVKAATERAGATVKVATDTASTVRTLADAALGKSSSAVTVKGSVVDDPGEPQETAPVRNVRAAAAMAAAKADKDETPRPPRRRTARRATTVEDVAPAPEPKPATRRPARASVRKAAADGGTEPARKSPGRSEGGAADAVAASSGNAAATDQAPATGTTASPSVEASAAQAATE